MPINVWDKAKEMGAQKTESGINWDWAHGFPSQPAAQRFVRWLEQNGYEHRGVYPDDQPTTFSVRFR